MTNFCVCVCFKSKYLVGEKPTCSLLKICYTGLAEPFFVAKHEDSLFKDLFQDYERWVRPVEHLNDKIGIKFGLAISQLVDVVGVGVLPDPASRSRVVEIALRSLSLRGMARRCLPGPLLPGRGPHGRLRLWDALPWGLLLPSGSFSCLRDTPGRGVPSRPLSCLPSVLPLPVGTTCTSVVSALTVVFCFVFYF